MTEMFGLLKELTASITPEKGEKKRVAIDIAMFGGQHLKMPDGESHRTRSSSQIDEARYTVDGTQISSP
ncbi:hypothetical protein Tco_0226768 [Tanacetum coccineum]